MKTAATILFLYFIGLFLQPTLFPLHHTVTEVKSCCSKKGTGEKHDGCGKDKGCCDSGSCNPFFSQCPLCAATAVVTTPFFTVTAEPHYYPTLKFGIYQQYPTNGYKGDILRPPQVVC